MSIEADLLDQGPVTAEGRGAIIWEAFCRQPGRIANGDTGDVACDHYHCFAEDLALMRKLGVQAYRFSLAWPRLLPQGSGPPNEVGLAQQRTPKASAHWYARMIHAHAKETVR